MGAKFTKQLLAVELDGKTYGVALSPEAMLKVLEAAASASPGGKLDLLAIPNQALFDLITEQNVTGISAEVERLRGLVDLLVPAIKDAHSALTSLNTRVQKDEDGDEICIQLNEWVQWIVTEIMPALAAAIAKAQ
jgi:hypothetical protein